MHALILLPLLLACSPTKVGGTDPTDGGGTDGGGSDGGGSDGGGSDGGGSDGGSADGGAPIEGLVLEVDTQIVTMLHASWPASEASLSFIEYRFEGEDWLVAPAVSPTSAVILGIPERTTVEARLVEVNGGEEARSDIQSEETGALPADLLLPIVDAWEPELADAAPYAMISLASGDRYTFEGPYQVLIFDRQGRIVWYDETPAGMITFYPSVALDGTHIWAEASDIFGFGGDSPHAVRRTLDGRWTQRTELAELGQAVGEGPDGSFFYERRSSRGVALMQIDADGTVSTIWDCAAWMSAEGIGSSNCYMNATNWTERHNSVLTSMFYSNTVFEIDLGTGQPVRQMGQLTVGEPYSFSPVRSTFDYQHFPNYTDEGTLLVSTHEPGVSGRQFAAEYTVDDSSRTLTRGWYYQSTDTWATQLGEALRLRNGNTIQGYGQDGAVREVTPDGEEAWFVRWEKDGQGYRAIGHLSLIDDLYALNRGPE